MLKNKYVSKKGNIFYLIDNKDLPKDFNHYKQYYNLIYEPHIIKYGMDDCLIAGRFWPVPNLSEYKLITYKQRNTNVR